MVTSLVAMSVRAVFFVYSESSWLTKALCSTKMESETFEDMWNTTCFHMVCFGCKIRITRGRNFYSRYTLLFSCRGKRLTRGCTSMDVTHLLGHPSSKK